MGKIGFQPKARPQPAAPFFHCYCLGQHGRAVREDPQQCYAILAERLAQERPPLPSNGWHYVRGGRAQVTFSCAYHPGDAYSLSTNQPELIQRFTALLLATVDGPAQLDALPPALPRRINGQDWAQIRSSWAYVMLGRNTDWRSPHYTRAEVYTRTRPAPDEAHSRLVGLYAGLLELHATPWNSRGPDLAQRIANVCESVDEIKRHLWVHYALPAPTGQQLGLFGEERQAA